MCLAYVISPAKLTINYHDAASYLKRRVIIRMTGRMKGHICNLTGLADDEYLEWLRNLPAS